MACHKHLSPCGEKGRGEGGYAKIAPMASRPLRHETTLYLLALLLALGLRFVRLGVLPLTDSEARLALDSLKKTLADAGLTMDDLVSVQVFCSDVSLYNEEKIVRGIEQDNFFDALRDELEEGRELYRSRVAPELFGRTNFYDRAIIDVILKSKGHVKSKIW